MTVNIGGPGSADITKIDGVALDTHDAGSMPSDVRTWVGTAPNALVSGRVDASVGAVAAAAITAAAIATDAIDADAIADNAIDASAIAAAALTAAKFGSQALAGQIIRSLQYGTILLGSGGASSGTLTISSVDTAKTFLIFLGVSSSGTTNPVGRLALTNSTTVTWTRNTNTEADTVGFVVVEIM